jgi:hypothetical protein
LSEKQFVRSSLDCKAPLWNLYPVKGKPWLAIEQRDDDNREVSFSLYDFELQHFVWRDVVLAERWWTILTGTTDAGLLIKVFESVENPDKSHLMCLSFETGAPIEYENVLVHTNTAFQPFLYADGETDFELIGRFLHKKLQVSAKLAIEYLEFEDFVFISFYEGAPAAFRNHISVFSKAGEFLLNEEIGTNLKGIGVNTFFIFSNHLFFVKNKTELVTFRIV